MKCCVSGGADGKPNREIRVSNLRQCSRQRPSRNPVAQRRTRGGRLSCRSEGRNARGRPLVLPHRPCQQTSMLVSARGRREAVQSAAPNSSRSAKPISPKAASPMQRSIADAHAELPAQTKIEQPRRNDALIPAVPAGAGVTENNAGTEAPGAATQRSVIAWRWPDPSSAWRVPDPSSADVSAAPTPNSGTPVTSVSPPRAPSRCLRPASWRRPICHRRPRPIPYEWSWPCCLGALALAGFAGSAIFKLVSRRRPRRAKVRRGAIWERRGGDSIPLSADPRANVVPRRTVFARDLDQSSDADRIEEFLSQLSKRARF